MTDHPAFPISPVPASASSTTPPEGAPAGEAAPPLAAPEAPKGPSFVELGLHADVLRAIDEMGFTDPMPVQAATFPLISAGRDLMVQSRTGSGKTAAFGIPFGNGLVNPDEKFVQAIVLLPTRELALQVASELAKICAYRQITVVPVYGGAPMGRQVEQLHAGGQIVCGTPGRVMDHMRRGTLRLDRVRCAVLDECDEMLSMGFQEDIETILSKTPTERQTLLFSATVPEGIQRLSRRFLRNPEFLKLSADYVGVHEIKHLYYSIPAIHRENELLQILAFEEPKSAIIFCNTREETGRVAEFLRQHGHDAEAISSDLSQSDRERVLGRMRAGGIKFLVATDVAARGIDIEKLSHVFNYTFPEAPEVYIHRTGRTGRAGRQGTAVSLIGPTEVGSFYYLKLLYKIKPEERALPSEAEIRSHREGERVLVLRRALEGEAGNDWRALARRLISAVDGERLIASLLAKTYAGVEAMPPAPVARPVADIAPRPAAEPRAREHGEHEGERERDRDRPRFGDRDRPRHGDRPRDRDRPRSGDRDRPRAFGDRERSGGGDRPRREDRPAHRHERRGPPPLRNDQPPAEREFWEVWSEERAQHASTEGTGAPAPTLSPFESAGGGEPAPAPEPTSDAGGGEPGAHRSDVGGGEPGAHRSDAGGGGDVARLYLNLGRKDGASERDIRSLLESRAPGASVVDVEVMNTHTYLNVGPTDAERIAASLTGQELGGRQLVCEPAKPRRR
jgi:ATP-dependent RNA helicase DeaD